MADNRLEFTFHICLGKGGFGEVYLATVKRDGGLARKMAVKVLKEGLDNENDAVQRLRDEGRMLALLNHPCILRAHDLCKVGGRVALVMEYVEGIDMAKACKPDRLLPPRCVVSSIGEVAGALDAAYFTESPETGRPLHLIHRDVKPENIRLTVHGQVKLLDFGIARSTEMVRHAQTKIGELPFTPGYAAPESFRRGEQGAESDVYALGVTLYRLLVGERLYEGMDVGDQFGVASLPDHYEPWLMERLALLRCDRKLGGLVARMLSYEKEARPTAKQVQESCEELSDEISGPTMAKWARTYEFPTPKEVKGAVLTGQTLREDPSGDVNEPPAPGKPAAPVPVPMGLGPAAKGPPPPPTGPTANPQSASRLKAQTPNPTSTRSLAPQASPVGRTGGRSTTSGTRSPSVDRTPDPSQSGRATQTARNSQDRTSSGNKVPQSKTPSLQPQPSPVAGRSSRAGGGTSQSTTRNNAMRNSAGSLPIDGPPPPAPAANRGAKIGGLLLLMTAFGTIMLVLLVAVVAIAVWGMT